MGCCCSCLLFGRHEENEVRCPGGVGFEMATGSLKGRMMVLGVAF